MSNLIPSFFKILFNSVLFATAAEGLRLFPGETSSGQVVIHIVTATARNLLGPVEEAAVAARFFHHLKGVASELDACADRVGHRLQEWVVVVCHSDAFYPKWDTK